jgi:hypothetical protein
MVIYAIVIAILILLPREPARGGGSAFAWLRWRRVGSTGLWYPYVVPKTLCSRFRHPVGSIVGRDAWRLQSQTRELELLFELETGKLLHDYDNKNSCLIFGPDILITIP